MLFTTDVDGCLWQTPIAADGSLAHGVSSELASPPSSKDCKHGWAVATIDNIQLAVIGPVNETDPGTSHSSVLHICFYVLFSCQSFRDIQHCHLQGSHASWKVLDFYLVKFPGRGKSWKMDLLLESPGNFMEGAGKSWNFC